jgi:hypothetical protein
MISDLRIESVYLIRRFHVYAAASDSESPSNSWRGQVRCVSRCALQSSFGIMTLLGVLQTVQSYASSGTAAGSDKKIDGNYTVLPINKVKILSLQTRVRRVVGGWRIAYIKPDRKRKCQNFVCHRILATSAVSAMPKLLRNTPL